MKAFTCSVLVVLVAHSCLGQTSVQSRTNAVHPAANLAATAWTVIAPARAEPLVRLTLANDVSQNSVLEVIDRVNADHGIDGYVVRRHAARRLAQRRRGSRSDALEQLCFRANSSEVRQSVGRHRRVAAHLGSTRTRASAPVPLMRMEKHSGQSRGFDNTSRRRAAKSAASGRLGSRRRNRRTPCASVA